MARPGTKSTDVSTPPSADIEAMLTRADPNLGRLIRAVVERVGVRRLARSHATPFEALVRAIVYQSVSAKAAEVIYKRLQDGVPGPLTPRKVLNLNDAQIRKLGLSGAKASAIHHLSDWFLTNALTAKHLPEMPNEAIIQALTGIPGIGLWTINVLLVFNLGRLDVMPTNDLGIRRGVQLIDGLKETPSSKLVAERSLKWQPYRSIASMYLWHVVRLKLTAADLKTATPTKRKGAKA
jgi:DNA-3-methyladenine glycosylase II